MQLILLALLACGSAPSATGGERPSAGAEARGTRADVDVAGLVEALEEGATLIDVRTPEEYARGHVPQADSVPLGFSLSDPAITALPKDEPVYVICASGNRSARAADQLVEAGYHAVNVEGGTKAWMSAGHPVSK